ncbi:retropepsin-like aspartic protease, partial [Candidatus Burkholderia verschuerenii]|uniref:retropepsin-like aspartic protease n=1 Tax=Candidatus Burkholderia verschuerenii TaxID=242163 RepID=UPI0012ED3CBC
MNNFQRPSQGWGNNNGAGPSSQNRNANWGNPSSSNAQNQGFRNTWNQGSTGQQWSNGPQGSSSSMDQFGPIMEVVKDVQQSVKKQEENIRNTFMRMEKTQQEQGDMIVMQGKKLEEHEKCLKNINRLLTEMQGQLKEKSFGTLPSDTIPNPKGKEQCFVMNKDEEAEKESEEKESSQVDEVFAIGGHSSDIIQKNHTLPPKREDPGVISVPAAIGTSRFYMSVCDPGSSISVISLAWVKVLNLTKHLQPCHSMIELADKSAVKPCGKLVDMIVQVKHLQIPTDLVVIDVEKEHSMPWILGRPFLATGDAILRVRDNSITFNVNGETVTFGGKIGDDQVKQKVKKVAQEVIKELFPSANINEWMLKDVKVALGQIRKEEGPPKEFQVRCGKVQVLKVKEPLFYDDKDFDEGDFASMFAEIAPKCDQALLKKVAELNVKTKEKGKAKLFDDDDLLDDSPTDQSRTEGCNASEHSSDFASTPVKKKKKNKPGKKARARAKAKAKIKNYSS